MSFTFPHRSVPPRPLLQTTVMASDLSARLPLVQRVFQIPAITQSFPMLVPASTAELTACLSMRCEPHLSCLLITSRSAILIFPRQNYFVYLRGKNNSLFSRDRSLRDVLKRKALSSRTSKPKEYNSVLNQLPFVVV